MIPVRGPTLFDKQFQEFVHGVQSKSGNPVMRAFQRKMQAKVKEEVKKVEVEKQNAARKRSTTKASVPTAGSISSKLKKRKKSALNQSGYESSESEGTKALNEQFENEPQHFVYIGSENYQKLPTIDQARIYLLQQSPKQSKLQMKYTNTGLMKTYLKKTLMKMEMDDPIELNKQVVAQKEADRLRAEREQLEKAAQQSMEFAKQEDEDEP